MAKKKVEIYTDGACSGNPGKGGWGVILKSGDYEKEIFGKKDNTTNNEMELTAVIMGLKAIKTECDITIYTDSKYVCDGINSWIHSWKINNWKNSQKKVIANLELWKTLDELAAKWNPKIEWIRGHDGHIMNERADKIARKAILNEN